MQLPIIKAEVDFTTLIYMVAVVLWVFGNLFSKRNKKKGNQSKQQQPAQPRPAPQSRAEEELRGFLDRMSGQREEQNEENYIEAPKPQPQVQQVRQSAAPSRPLPVQTPEPETVESKSLPTLTSQSSAGMGAAFASALRSTGSQFKLTEANISILKQSMKSTHPIPAAPVVTRKDLKNKKMFRKAMVAQIILGTPRAFETSDVPDAIRH